MFRTFFLLFFMISSIGMATSAGAKDWETNFKRALTRAEENNKYMLLNFSGSDWCFYCKKLDKEVFNTKDFQAYARSNFICVVLDFPANRPQERELKAQNMKLVERFSVQGYPTIVILNPKGELIIKTGYLSGGAKKYIEHLKEIICAYEGKSS